MQLSILHYNDVYRVSPQKLSSKSKETIDVSQFAALLQSIRPADGLVLFSGDLFSPSVESSVTRGSHLVPVMNLLAPTVALTGNHDFDFGYPHLTKLVQDCNFPWLLSNIIDNTTNTIPAHLHEFKVFERSGLRVGVIGLVEKEWIGTVATWPSHFEYRDMKQVALDLSARLRDVNGEHKCDIIIALTHARVPNDIKLAKDVLALSPAGQESHPIHQSHGVDLILGGHDHLYFASKGVNSWQGYDTSQGVLGAEEDKGDILVVKSGTDFRDLSEITLTLLPSPGGSIRRVTIQNITGKRHVITSSLPSSEEMSSLLKTILSSVSETLKAPVCKTTVAIDVRSQYIRVSESAVGNWMADILRHTYDDTLCMKGVGGADGVLMCAGTLRGDSVYGPGNVTLGDILEILPFEDPVVVLELDGAALWDALEASFSTWPAQEGRFPVISGFRVSWDSRREPGNRVLGIWLLKEVEDSEASHTDSGRSTPRLADDEPIKRIEGGRKYKIVTRDYMAQGHDGFVALKGQTYLVDDESGQMMSTIVRKYLMGCHFINKLARQTDYSPAHNLNQDTNEAVLRERHHRRKQERKKESRAIQNWKRAASLALRWSRSRAHYRDHLSVSTTEHMSSVDVFDGKQARTGRVDEKKEEENDEDLLVVSPEIDGRLKDDGR